MQAPINYFQSTADNFNNSNYHKLKIKYYFYELTKST